MADDDRGQQYAGQAGITAPGSGHNARALQHRIQQDARRSTVAVKVLKVYPDPNGGPPTADVQPLINQVDGLGVPTPHGPVYGVATGRAHSGSGAVVSDPVAGDIYQMHVHDRDITKLKNTGQQSSPDSDRRSSMADGVLGHAMLTGKPKQAVVFKPGGGVQVYDNLGAVIETFPDKRVTLTSAAGGSVILGGNGQDGGTYSPVQTVAGPSTIVQAKL